MIDPSDAAEPIENAEATDPIDPIESADPTEPIDSTEPREPIESSESSDQSDHFEPDRSVSVWLDPAGILLLQWCRGGRTLRLARRTALLLRTPGQNGVELLPECGRVDRWIAI
jgi:hypothetical protein